MLRNQNQTLSIYSVKKIFKYSIFWGYGFVLSTCGLLISCGGGGSSSSNGAAIVSTVQNLPVQMVRAVAPAVVKTPFSPSFSGCSSATKTPLLTINDPFYAYKNDIDPFAWHLFGQDIINQTKATETYEVLVPWQQGITGECVAVAVVDSRVDREHEDIKDNFLVDNSVDYGGYTQNDLHGTAVAGVIAGVANNGSGALGVAPNAKIVGVNLIDNLYAQDSDETDALYHASSAVYVYSNSWGPDDKTGALLPLAATSLSAIEKGVVEGRGGRGSIYLVASGNGRLVSGGLFDDSNYDGFANYRSVIAVGGADSLGNNPYYAEGGANVLVAGLTHGHSYAVGRTILNTRGIFAPDLNNKYISSFNGTSAAAPGVSGIVALILQANPELTWRDVRWILAASARKNNATDSGWQSSQLGAGFNHKYGYGVLSASSAVAMAQNFTTLPPLKSCRLINSSSSWTLIPDNNSDGVLFHLDAGACDLTVESVELKIAFDHSFFGDFDIQLISPLSRISQLSSPHRCAPSCSVKNGFPWTFSSVRHLNEKAAGLWKVSVKDLSANDVGYFRIRELIIWGY